MWRATAEIVQGALVLVPGSVPVHGVRATDLPGEPARHRGVPARRRAAPLSHGLPQHRFAEHWRMPTSVATGAFTPTPPKFSSVRRARCIPTSPSPSTSIRRSMRWIPPPSICVWRCFPGLPLSAQKRRSNCTPLLDLHGNIPSVVHITHGRISDVSQLIASAWSREHSISWIAVTFISSVSISSLWPQPSSSSAHARICSTVAATPTLWIRPRVCARIKPSSSPAQTPLPTTLRPFAASVSGRSAQPYAGLSYQ